MNQSENISELVAALSKAQGEMEPAKFNKKGQRHRYADFTSVMHSCRAPLSLNSLAVMQYVETVDKQHILVTMLTHTSGQWIKSHLPLLVSELTCQALGSSMTYMKRYGLSALLGIVSDADEGADDDGELAMSKVKPQSAPQQVRSEPLEILGKDEVTTLTKIIDSLDEESVKSFFYWIGKAFNAKNVHEIPKSSFEQCMIHLNNKVKYINYKNKQTTAAAVA